MKQTTKERARKVARAGLAMQATGDTILSLGTIFAAYQGARSFLFGIVDGYSLLVACTIVAVLAYYMLDHGKKTVFPATIAWIIGKKDRETASERMPLVFHIFTAIMSALMLGGSYYSNVIITPDIAEAAASPDTGKPDQYGAMVDDATSLYTSDRAAYDQDVAAAQSALSSIEAKQNQARATIERANPGLVSALKTSRQWAEKELRQKTHTEARRYDRDRKRAQKALTEAQEARAAFIASRGGETSKTISQLAAMAGLEHTKGEAKLGRWSAFTKIVMLIGLLSFMAGTVVVVSYEDTTDEVITPDTDLVSAIGGKVGGFIDWTTRAIDGAGKKNGKVEFAIAGASGGTYTPPTTGASTRDKTMAEIRETHRRIAEETGHCVGGNCDVPHRSTEGQNTEGQNTERQKDRRTEGQDRTDRNTEKAEQTSGVGAGVTYPDASNQDDVKAFIKRFRSWADYNPTDNRVPQAIGWLKSNGYQVEEKSAGKYRVTRHKATSNSDGAIIHEWDVFPADAE